MTKSVTSKKRVNISSVICTFLATTTISLTGVFVNSSNAQAQTSACSSLGGKWYWDDRAFVANMTFRFRDRLTTGYIRAMDGGNFINGSWRCDPSNRTLTVTWDSSNITDTLTVGYRSLVGTNSNGKRIVAIKRTTDRRNCTGSGITISGNWWWDNRFVAVMYSDGSVLGNDRGQLIRGRWRCLGRNGRFEISWNTNITDTMYFTGRRVGIRNRHTGALISYRQFEGYNSNGDNVSALRADVGN